ncbi:MAG: hypothetical protein LUC31_01730 [Coprobacillus sp.]|nr:hypothetical protein [Coprobacillus sp.]
MKREDITGLIVYLIIFAVVIIFGVTVISTHYGDSLMNQGIYILYVIGAILVGIVFNAILYELGHVLGGLAGGYNIVSVNILGFNLYKDGDKVKFRFHGFDGFTGETTIVPRENAKKEPRPALYLFMGTILYAIELVLVIVFFSIYNSQGPLEGQYYPVASNTVYFLLIVAVIGGIIVFYNILPFHLDSMTDGYKLTMTTNKANAQAYNALLKSEYDIAQGKENIEIPTFENITNFTADLNLNKVYVLLDNKQFEEAETLLDLIIANKEKISAKTYLRTYAQKIYINIAYKGKDEAKEYYDNEVPLDLRREISQDNAMPSIRAYVLMAGVLDRSRSEVLLTIEKSKKAYKRTPEGRKHTEFVLFNEALLMVDALHPDWDLKHHLLQESISKK